MSAADAALIGGTSGHALDYDDVGIGVHPAHPTVPMAPALFAEAEVLGRSGRDIIEAYVTGYEVWVELGGRDATPQHQKGWHMTGVFGAIAAAAACARLRRLDAKRAANAVGIAASQGAGLVANFGSMTKPFHAGRAASVGLMSARYAEAGMTASPDVIESANGLLHAVSPAGRVDRDRPVQFMQRWHSIEKPISLKLYPMCYASHRALEAMIPLARQHDLAPDAIRRITVRMSPSRATSLVNTSAMTGLDAKFSMEFAMAMAVIARRATLAETTDAFVRRPDVQALMKKVVRDLDPALDAGSFSADPGDSLSIEFTDGRRIEQKLSAPNDVAHSVDPDTLWTKFADCAGAAATPAQTRALFDGLQGLATLASTAALPVIDWPTFGARATGATREAAE